MEAQLNARVSILGHELRADGRRLDGADTLPFSYDSCSNRNTSCRVTLSLPCLHFGM